MKKFHHYFIFCFLGIASGLLGAFIFDIIPSSQDRLIADFYEMETVVMVSPHGLRKQMMDQNNNFILVDVRSQEEYEKEHIIGAVNIPAYKDRETSAYGDVERIVNSFSSLAKENPDKEIIVYCYSMPCMTGRKVGHMLADHNIFVKQLGVGWNEWRYYWELWNHEHELNTTRVQDYIHSGPEPGVYVPQPGEIESCGINNEFGC